MIDQKSSESSLQTQTPAPEALVPSRISPWLASLAYPLVCFVILPLYFGRIEVTGQENLPTKGPVILAPTHRSRWDSLLVPAVTGPYVSGRYPRYMTRTTEVTGLKGWLILRLGAFPINPKRATISSLRHGIELLLQGEMLSIYPEGGIFRDRQVHPLKPGLARMAVKAESMNPGLGVKIVPISLHYGKPFPTWRCGVKIRIGSPLTVADYCGKSTKKSAQQLNADLETALKKLHEE